MTKGPILIDLEGKTQDVAPDQAPPIPDEAPPQGRAMQVVATLAARKPSALTRLFWSLLVTLMGIAVSVATWDFLTSMVARSPVLGYAVSVLVAAFLAVVFALALRELAAFARLRRVDALQRAAETALANDDLEHAREVVGRLKRFYAKREDTRWGLSRLEERLDDQFDAATLLAVAEDEILAPLDQVAMREVEAAARQVATVTALVPLALADVAAALTANFRMIRRISEVYGGRSGVLGGWRLTKAVLTHLVATGVVAVGDDMLGSIAGGSVLAKVSRRFGEGLVNGALTARVGVAAMEVARPIPFTRRKRPSVSGLVKRALTGLIASG